jgi:hypothetical protein
MPCDKERYTMTTKLSLAENYKGKIGSYGFFDSLVKARLGGLIIMNGPPKRLSPQV